MMAETAGREDAAPEDDATAPHPLEFVVDRWWDDHFPGSAVARSTAAWNHAFAAKEELKRRLKEI